jgi:large subunit ribosomal protein L6
MSRIGKQPISIPGGVEASIKDGVFTVKGPKGALSRAVRNEVSVTIAENVITLTPARESDLARALWGTYASHIMNMIEGVTKGFEKKLEIEGVGYRGEVKGKKFVLAIGFSHPVEIDIPEGIVVSVEKGVFTINGIDKDVLGQFAATVRGMKEPEPYKGKGIRYQGEYIIRKQGKKAV